MRFLLPFLFAFFCWFKSEYFFHLSVGYLYFKFDIFLFMPLSHLLTRLSVLLLLRFWILILYELNSLQIFSPTLLPAPSLCWSFPLQCRSFPTCYHIICLGFGLMDLLLGTFPRSLCLSICLAVFPKCFPLVIWQCQTIGLDYRSIFELIFVRYVVWVLFQTCEHVDSIFSSSICWACLFSLYWFQCTGQKLVGCRCVSSFLGFLLPFIDLHVYFCARAGCFDCSYPVVCL